jgi:hypothetical protein
MTLPYSSSMQLLPDKIITIDHYQLQSTISSPSSLKRLMATEISHDKRPVKKPVSYWQTILSKVDHLLEIR